MFYEYVVYFLKQELLTHCHKNVKTPNTWHQVKHTQLTRLIKLGVLALGKVETPVYFLQRETTQRITWMQPECMIIMAGMPTRQLRHCHARGRITVVEITRTREDNRCYLWLLLKTIHSRSFGNDDDSANIKLQSSSLACKQWHKDSHCRIKYYRLHTLKKTGVMPVWFKLEKHLVFFSFVVLHFKLFSLKCPLKPHKEHLDASTIIFI